MKVVSFVEHWIDELRPRLDPAISLVVVDRQDANARDRELAGADVVFTYVFDAAMGRASRKLRLLLCAAAGTENIDRSALPEGARVINSEGPEVPMAEYVIGMMVALRQNVFRADRALREGRWVQGFTAGGAFGDELFGSNLGLVGFGRAGQQSAKRAHAFGMTCRGVTMQPNAPRPLVELLEGLEALSDPAAVDRLFGWADAVVLCCELSGLTRGLVDRRRLNLMKPTALLINVARGAIASEQDLFEALRDRRIAGAAIDAWYAYPEKAGETVQPSAYPFQALDNVIMTPHSSAWTIGHKLRKLAFWSRVLNGFARSGNVPEEM